MENRLTIYSSSIISSYVKKREQEKKIGEQIQVCDSIDPFQLTDSLRNTKAKYVLLGLPEDIGVRANYGKAGTSQAWEQTLHSFLNIQSNSYLNGSEILLLGHLDFDDLMLKAENSANNMEVLRKLTAEIDQYVSDLILIIVSCGKEAIVIGGGHNNSYGCIKGASMAMSRSINCINCDAHSDFRVKEGRHSGNGFRYAKDENFLDRYSIFALHENYISEDVLQKLRSEDSIEFSLYEDLYIRKQLGFEETLTQHIKFIKDSYCGIELDLDSIQHISSSAMSPSGISVADARRFVYRCASELDSSYIHFSEAAPASSGISGDNQCGKLLSYLISDYVKARVNKN